MARPFSNESVFRALAHPTRRGIILALRRGELPAGQVLPSHAYSKAALSGHLRALTQAGLIGFRRRGTRLMYRLNTGALRPVEQFLASVRPRR